ncbi:DSF2 Protein DSF2 [Candida maltosa Xu316]
MASIQTTGRLLDRLELDTSRLKSKPQPQQQQRVLAQQRTVLPIQPLNNLADIRGLKNQHVRDDSQKQKTLARNQDPGPSLVPAIQKPVQRSVNDVAHTQKPQQAPAHLRHVPMNLVFENTNKSVETIKSDMASLKKIETPPKSLSASVSESGSPDITKGINRSSSSSPVPISLSSSKSSSSSSLKTLKQLYNNDSNIPALDNIKTRSSRSNSVKPSTLDRPTHITRTPSAPILQRNGSNGFGRIKEEEEAEIIIDTRPKRVRSDSTNSTSSFTSVSSNNSQTTLQPSQQEITIAESRTNAALELRSLGNHREASYQLQIVANDPYNYPKAMFLYAMALKFGQGVKQNDKHAIKWLCKCILMSSSLINSTNATSVIEKLNNLPMEELIKLIMRNLKNTIDKDPHKNGQDPLILYPIFKKLTEKQVLKIISINKNKADVVAASYHELGNFLINGWGISAKDETSGILCLSKAGSMGFIDSMVQLGEIWTNKTKYHKKDLTKAAGWLRLSEIFGVKSIGNSWIYKDKYMSY